MYMCFEHVRDKIRVLRILTYGFTFVHTKQRKEGEQFSLSVIKYLCPLLQLNKKKKKTCRSTFTEVRF